MEHIFSEKITYKKKTLGLTILNTHAKACDFKVISRIVREEYKQLATYIHSAGQFLYIRDNPDLTIENRLPAGHTYFPTESMIAVPDWTKIDYTELRAVIAHELHHMARAQNIGYGESLGEVLASEGLATYYEEVRTGRKAEWAVAKIPSSAINRAHNEWKSKDYNHYEWFYESPNGKWIGYALGYMLAKRQFPEFNLTESLTASLKIPDVD